MAETILAFSTTSLWEIHNAQILEICLRESTSGNTILVYHCQRSIAACRTNPNDLVSRCRSCIKQSKRNQRIFLPKGISNIRMVDVANLKMNSPEFHISSHEEMFLYNYQGFPFGRAVISQLQTVLRESEISNRDIQVSGNKILANAICLFHFFNREICEKGVSKIYVFGGRYAAERALIFAAKSSSIKFETFETGSALDKIWTSELGETSFQSYISDIQAMESGLLGQSREVALREGQRYFLDWRGGQSHDPKYLNPNIGKKQSEATTFEVIDNTRFNQTQKRKMVAFTSTNYEVLAFDDFQILDSEKNTQYSVIQAINDCEEITNNFDVKVRWHPNSLTSSPSDIARMKECINSSPNLNHIEPESNVNSYILIENCDIVVSFGSTIGIEASAMGKPVILLGKCSYSNIGATLEPRNFSEFVNQLSSTYGASNIEQALIWASWRSSFGNKLRFVSMRGGFKFYINGRRIATLNSRLNIVFNLIKHKIKNKVLI